MTDHQKLYIAYSRLVGEFTGMLKGLLWHNIEEEIKDNMRKKTEVLKAIDIHEFAPKSKPAR